MARRLTFTAFNNPVRVHRRWDGTVTQVDRKAAISSYANFFWTAVHWSCGFNKIPRMSLPCSGCTIRVNTFTCGCMSLSNNFDDFIPWIWVFQYTRLKARWKGVSEEAETPGSWSQRPNSNYITLNHSKCSAIHQNLTTLQTWCNLWIFRILDNFSNLDHVYNCHNVLNGRLLNGLCTII